MLFRSPYLLWAFGAVFAITALNGFFNYWMVTRKPSKENNRFFEFMGTDGRAISGYSALSFNLKGLYYAGDEALSLQPQLQEGQYCTIRHDWYNPKDTYAMQVIYAGTPIGYVDSAITEKVYTIFRSRQFVSCFIEKRIDREGRAPELTLKMIYTDEEGHEPYEGLQGDVQWTVIDTTHFAGEVTDRYIQCLETLQLIDMQCELYGLKGVDDKSDSSAYCRMQEDNIYLIDFIMAYNCGEIPDGSEKTAFLRRINAARTFGNNDILKKRIKYYIEAAQLQFVY